MFRKMIYLSLVLFLVNSVQAADVTWTDTTGDHLWSTEVNWEDGYCPTSADWVIINMLPGPIITNEGIVAKGSNIGTGSNVGALTVDGETLTITEEINTGSSSGSVGTINMKSGAINISSWFYVGRNGYGIVNMTGGTITVGMFCIADKATAIGQVHLDGGIFTTNDIRMRRDVGAVGSIDVTAGTLIINGDKLSLVQEYIDNGWIAAYDGQGTLNLDYDITNEGKTTLTATHLLNPNPVDGALISPGEVELSWTLLDPCVPGQLVLVDVYFTDDLQLLEEFTDPAAIQLVSKQNVTSIVMQNQLKKQYYWVVDTYVGNPNDPVFGPIFSFTVDNLPPNVDAGADVVTWLEEGVIRTGNLNATVIDDGAINPYIPYVVQWTVVSEPNDPNSPDTVIAKPRAEDTSITLEAVGEYILQLDAFDGEYTSSDTVTINVYNDSCEAAQSLPDYILLVGDLNGDCLVDDADFALMGENWLKDNSLIEEWFRID